MSASWAVLDLGPYLRGEVQEVKPGYLTRSDQTKLLYPSHVHWLSGEPEGMKSWLAQVAIAEILKASDRPNAALYVDFESDIGPIVGRFLALGVTAERLRTGLLYVRPEEPLDDYAQATFQEAALSYRPEITCLDGVNAGMGLCGMDPNSSRDFNNWWMRLGRPVQLATKGPTLAIDHVAKDPERRGQYPLGTGSKLAVTDVHIGVDVIQPFGRGLTGRARLLVKKDRPGWLRGQAAGGRTLAELELKSDLETGAVAWQLDPASSAGADGFRPTVLMERISRCLEVATEALSTRAILAAVTGKATGKQQALKVLAAEGYLQVQPGPRDGLLYRSVKPFRDGQDDRFPTVSRRFPGNGEDDCFPVSPPLTGGKSGHGQSGSQILGSKGTTVSPLDGRPGRTVCETCGGPLAAAWNGQLARCLKGHSQLALMASPEAMA